jgi:hypothetical protein
MKENFNFYAHLIHQFFHDPPAITIAGILYLFHLQFLTLEYSLWTSFGLRRYSAAA